jgi:hypothetical protein
MMPYLLLVLIVFSIIIFMTIFYLRESKFLVVYLILLAFPWTFPSTGLLNFITLIAGGKISIIFLLLFVCSLLNAAILYFIGLIIDKLGILQRFAKWFKSHSVLGDDERLR